MLREKLQSLDLPELRSYDEMIAALRREVYGTQPPEPIEERVLCDKVALPRFNGGKAPLHEVEWEVTIPQGSFTLNFTYAIPKDVPKPPVILQMQFSRIHQKYQPTEELLDRGYAVFNMDYATVAPDREDGFREGLGAVLFPDGRRKDDAPGKIAMWSWALSRVMDFIQTLDGVDAKRVTVAGHSRLGKTALLTGAQDHRFCCAFSSCAGAAGDALARCTRGETVEQLCARFPYWFCENYEKYRGKHDLLPLDQHWLIACNAPHLVYISCASEDLWADPQAEYLSCAAASDAFPKGFVCPDRLPQIGDCFPDGDVGFHERWGEHCLAREDWLRFLDFWEKH